MSQVTPNGGDKGPSAKKADGTTKESIHVTNLPAELLERILLHLARLNYDSLYSLSAACLFFRQFCQDFMRKNPAEKFLKPVCGRPAGLSDSEDEDEIDQWDDVNEHADDFDPEDLLEQLSDLSFGSNLDEEQLDAYLARSSPEGDVVVNNIGDPLRGNVSGEEW